MLNFKITLMDGPESDKPIATVSYRVVNATKFKRMSLEQKKNLVDMIDRFSKMLSATRKQVKDKKYWESLKKDKL